MPSNVTTTDILKVGTEGRSVTPSPGDNSTKIATTAFVTNAVTGGGFTPSGTANQYIKGNGTYGNFYGPVVLAMTAPVTVANTTTQTDIIGTLLGTNTFPSGSISAGDRVILKGHITISTFAASQSLTLIFTLLNYSPNVPINITSQVGAKTINYEIEVIPFATGTSVNGSAYYRVSFPTDNSFARSDFQTSSVLSSAINTSATTAISATAQWGTADVGNTLIHNFCTLEIYKYNG